MTPEPGAMRTVRRPDWLKVRLPGGKSYLRIREIVDSGRLNTVCEDARCPNMGECWGRGTATFMILGDVCTRSCGFCAVKTGRPGGLDLDEPRRVAEAVRSMGIKHAVITSVNRDERRNGGAPIFAETVRRIRNNSPDCTVEVLIPDFKGEYNALMIVLEAEPDILNHNVETVPRLYRLVRPQADYLQSLELIRRAKDYGAKTKSGMMVGIGEEPEEVFGVLDDLKAHGCDIITIGQYLQPTKKHLLVERYVHPLEFTEYKVYGVAIGFEVVESAPLVRSSYHAEAAASVVVS